MTAKLLNTAEVFGPESTLMPYDNSKEACTMIGRGEGSRVRSVYSEDPDFTAQASVELASSPGKVLPMSLHGGAGDGEELVGLRALNFYQRRSALQGSARPCFALDPLAAQGATLSLCDC